MTYPETLKIKIKDPGRYKPGQDIYIEEMKRSCTVTDAHDNFIYVAVNKEDYKPEVWKRAEV